MIHSSLSTSASAAKEEVFLNLKAEERELLIDSMMHRAEIALLNRDVSGVELFDSAAKLEPQDPRLFYRQALALYECGTTPGKERLLFIAAKKCKIATSLQENLFSAWLLWGNILSTIGSYTKECRYFLEAEKRLKKAIDFSQKRAGNELIDLYSAYGSVWTSIFHHSQEPCDLQKSINAFERCTSISETLPAGLWHSFGTASLCLADRINNPSLYAKAIYCFRQAITAESTEYKHWLKLAQTLEKLFYNTHDEEIFSQANDCFSQAAHCKPLEGTIWFEWARFLCSGAARTQEPKQLRAAIEKCQKALSCNYDHSMVLSVWAEALAHLGVITDRVDLLYEAENKASEALELSDAKPDIWRSCGICLHALGTYFNDIDLYYQAIEKFQQGLSINRAEKSLWHSLALSYAEIALAEADFEPLSHAIRFFNKLLDLHTTSYYLFDYALFLSKFGELSHEKKWLEEALFRFEQAIGMQKNSLYLHPDWLFHYASTLDQLGDFYDDLSYYTRAIEIFSHVLMIKPDYPQIHHKLALAFSHHGELSSESDYFYKSLHHYRIALKQDEENDLIILDFGLTQIHLAEQIHDRAEADLFYREAENRILQAAKLGNLQAYYHLSCLYSLLGQYDKSIYYLYKADQFDALPPLEEMMEDDWLDDVKNRADFQAFAANLEARSHNHRE